MLHGDFRILLSSSITTDEALIFLRASVCLSYETDKLISK